MKRRFPVIRCGTRRAHVVGGHVLPSQMGWAGWQELQAEGGTLKIGNAPSGAAAAPPAPMAVAPQSAAPEPAAETDEASVDTGPPDAT